MFKLLHLILLSFLLSTNPLYALTDEQIPKSLQEWKAWVLDDVKERDCPVDFQSNQHLCAFPTHIEVHLKKKSLSFKMMVASFKDKQSIMLPHIHQHWVKEVMVDGKSSPVFGSDNAMLYLDEGEHIIEGIIDFKEMPKYLQLPSKMALVSLYRDKEQVTSPKVDTEARLWLTKNPQNSNKKGELSVSIYRKLIDGHPLKMQTNLHFRVSGKMRLVLLDGIVLDGFSPSALSGELDAKITKDKKLEVEVKAGEWVLNIDSYASNNITKFHAPKHRFEYANQETLSLQSDASYRTIEVTNAQSIDPTQSNIPKMWKSLPLYLLEKDKNLTIKELYKSAKQQQKNEFLLNRKIWLDFDAKGYSIKDLITAKISEVKRLESLGSIELGSVVVNSKPMLINTLKESQHKGVELREKELKIEASSRYMANLSLLPANGWSEEFNRVTTELNLPPQWKIFASFGSDSQSDKSWVKEWDLMDIFLVLLLGIAIYQLFGLKWSIPATFFLIILWHEAQAPTLIWLWILVLVALIRVLNEGKIKKILQVIFAISSIFVILNVLQFLVYKIRTTLYPQLEQVSYIDSAYLNINNNDNSMIQPVVIAQEEARYIKKRVTPNHNRSNSMVRPTLMPQKSQLLLQNRIDPNAIVQTGEGTPTWSWTQHKFYWQSTVGKEDMLEIWFITPTVTKVLNMLNIIGVLFLLFMFLQSFIQSSLKDSSLKGLNERLFKHQTLNTLLFLSLVLWSPQQLKAEAIPSPQLLNELKSKLLEPPVCLPNCASIEKIEILTKEDKLFINMNISAGADISVPILGNRNIWLPQKVSVNKSDKSYLQLDKSGGLWVMLRRGVHKIELTGSIKGLNHIMLSSQLPIHNLTTQNSDLWRINSDNKSYIELINLDKNSAKSREKAKSAIEPIIEVERTFYFGLRWYVDTTVKLLNKIDKPYTLHYHLLENESVLNKEIEIENQEVTLHLQNSHPSYKWRSSLAITPQLLLKASSQKQITERWKMDISSMWNINYQGIESENQTSTSTMLMPTFRPWSKETLTLNIEPIKAVQGKSLTIESSDLQITQSQRYRDLTLTLKLKSSQAQQYLISLDNIKELSSVTIDNQNHYLKMNQNQLSIPLKGKAQTVVIRWKEEAGVQNHYNFSKINLNQESVNSKISLHLPQNRWILWTDGPLLGPAVLLWGVLLSVFLLALILGKIPNSPLKVRDWLLLGLGVSTSSIMLMLPIVIWIFILRYREEQEEALQGKMRNFIQIMIPLLTIIAMITLIGAISAGLLGNPDMMIQGNGSYGFTLNWYEDRVAQSLAQPTVISLSMWYYRALMLLWAIWISLSLIGWLKWAWSVFSSGNMWVNSKKSVEV